MSDFVSSDILPDLWEEILQQHWTFLETEESLQKLDERKKLEGCLKEFLCIVPHDRKFFLPETAHVLKRSITKMDDFSAYKAMIGFESISQYANNLFTKPWRKEYRVIKMYSGFYQHEIKSNLIDAEKLFEAMGYKQLPNQLLGLDGPVICPDQVTNVSRDAMAMAMECQIMKQILSGLSSMKLSCSWLNILNFREAHIGGVTQAIKAMAYAIQERQFRRETQLNSELSYGNIPATIPLQQQPVPGYNNRYNQQKNASQLQSYHAYPLQPTYISNTCSIHSQTAQNLYHQSQPPQMSHSKSLEHKRDHTDPLAFEMLPHRHSFDQPSHYDCVDSYQNCNLNVVYNHPNRCSLVAAGVGHYNINSVPICGHNNYFNGDPTDHLYGMCNGLTKKQPDLCNYHYNNDLLSQGCGGQFYQNGGGLINGQRIPSLNNVRTEQLIDLKDQNPGYRIMNINSSNNNNGLDYTDRLYGQTLKSQQSKLRGAIQFSSGMLPQIQQPQYDLPRSSYSAIVQENNPKDLDSKTLLDGSNELNTSNFNNTKKSNSMSRKSLSSTNERNHTKSTNSLLENDNNDRHSNSTLRESFGSFEQVSGLTTESQQAFGPNTNRLKSISNKNQDGVGSFESWDYVFQNLEKHGYTKDLGERGDLLVQGLDLDCLNVSGNSTEKRRSRNLEPKNRIPDSSKTKSVVGKNDGALIPALVSSSVVIRSTENLLNKPKEKSILKHDNETVQKTINKTTQVQKARLHQPQQNHQQNNNPTNDSISLKKKENLLTNGSAVKNGYGINASVSTSSRSPATVAAQSSNAEWNCRSCTFLNPESKRICEMCCRSKDFNFDATNPPTCV